MTADCGGKSLRLRSNESPSGAFEQQNGLAQARWRGLAPTSLDLSSSAGPELFSRETEELFVISGTFANNRAAVFCKTAALFYTALFALCAEFRVLFQQGLEVLAGKAARHLGHLLRRTLGDDEAAGTATLGAEVDDVVGALDEV